MMEEPTTLGDVLDANSAALEAPEQQSWSKRLSNAVMTLFLVLVPIGGSIWYVLEQPAFTLNVSLAMTGVCVLWVLILTIKIFNRSKKARLLLWQNILLAHDRQGFMSGLKLDAKTAIIDGSNLYHFGHDNGIDAQALGHISQHLREDGYRVVCFFDANIFYTLRDHGAFAAQQSHDLSLLEDIFGLQAQEIYVVPSGVQADQYILESLRWLPTSFAVTNDRFRDYGKAYRDVMKTADWRKGALISKNELKLHSFRFSRPIRLDQF